ncbi:DUF192 domain-containing protein [Geomonas sp. Red32]|uniref:DUF192 domain-containing protein n=1 Tax=Geomonas sp. Red32 TaxID=2912856 RepID=UPI00202CAB69|nr:DUF192 domain-containing protein [Geomonas sp. Red32]MCM0082887.1 DUF192 domain-containing protein [Geomonas sp. Red32]
MRAVNGSSGAALAADLRVACTLLARARGLLGKSHLPHGEGLLISPCKGVHTFFMRFPIDVIFLDNDDRVIQIREYLQPYRVTGMHLGCRRVMELPAGTVSASGTAAGDLVLIG